MTHAAPRQEAGALLCVIDGMIMARRPSGDSPEHWLIDGHAVRLLVAASR